ncbi:MAG: hypothetical protein ACK5JT_16275 [Hyphomicrobiaceae bacterium]
MIYVVEMDFRNAEREHDWHTWYLAHTTHLVRTVPGFTGTQRFRSITPSDSPWVAIHEVSGPEVFDSREYRSGGGPASTGEWKDLHTNWHRNLFDGAKKSPSVLMDQHLLMAEGDAPLPRGYESAATRLTGVGLDRTSQRRSIAIVPASKLTAAMFDLPGVRVLKPITPKISR